MRFRWWIHVLAAFGVLLHAGALARHNGVMLGYALQSDALAADLTAICHGGTTANAPGSNLPGAPAPASPSCPICMGLAPVAALPAAADLASPPVTEVALRLPVTPAGLAQIPYAACPPARGPPALA
jgi:hypothetical protein